ncbi:MAG: hypothetical protein MJ168_01460 [Clostridia bacterium]|nr:hypothetical protein [Clostridia bacterium]
MLKKLNRRAFVIIVAVVAVIAIVGTSLAWFTTSSSMVQKFNIFGFDVSANVYFDNDGKKISANSYKDENGLYLVSTDKNASNYIGKLRVNVNHSGGNALVRVKMNYELAADGAGTQYNVSVPFKFDSKWFDNRTADYCVYYMGDGSGKADFTKTELIKGFDEANFDTAGFVESTSIKLLVQVDAVQVNRYPQMWNIDTLPWK